MVTALIFPDVHPATQADVTASTLAGAALILGGDETQLHQNLRNLIKIIPLHTILRVT